MDTKIAYNLDFSVGIDPYRRDTGGQTEPAMYLVIDDNVVMVIVSQENPGETGMWADELLNVNVSLPYCDEYDEDITPDAHAFEQYIKSPAATALIERIANGYDWEWSGQQPGDGNRVAILNDDANTALAALEVAIADLPASGIVWWNADEWFGETDWEQITATEVDGLIAEPVNPDDNIRLTEDPTEFVLKQFAESLQDELKFHHADSDSIAARGATVTVERDEDGDVKDIVSVITPAGNRWEP